MSANRREFLLGAATVAAGSSFPSLAHAVSRVQTSAPAEGGASPFVLEFDGVALSSLKFAGDAIPTNYVAAGQTSLVLLIFAFAVLGLTYALQRRVLSV